MVTLFLGFHNNIISVVPEEILEHIMQNDSHGKLVGGTSIFRTAGY